MRVPAHQHIVFPRAEYVCYPRSKRSCASLDRSSFPPAAESGATNQPPPEGKERSCSTPSGYGILPVSLSQEQESETANLPLPHRRRITHPEVITGRGFRGPPTDKTGHTGRGHQPHPRPTRQVFPLHTKGPRRTGREVGKEVRHGSALQVSRPWCVRKTGCVRGWPLVAEEGRGEHSAACEEEEEEEEAALPLVTSYHFRT